LIKISKGNLFVISGPSGSGKSSLCKELCKDDNFYLSISSTTRSPRGNEQNEKDYFFISKEDFKAGIEQGRFVEWAEVHGNFYGTDKLKIEQQLALGKIVLFDIDVQGYKILRQKYKELVTAVFITTKNEQILKQRLLTRATETPKSIAIRLKNAKEEMKEIGSYDYLLINDFFDDSLNVLRNIAACISYKKDRFRLTQFINEWSET